MKQFSIQQSHPQFGGWQHYTSKPTRALADAECERLRLVFPGHFWKVYA